MPVAAQVIRHAAERPHRLALRGPGGSLTYAELARRVKGEPIPQVALLSISTADPVSLIVRALAADLAGVTPLVCDPAQHARLLPATGRPGGGWACFTSGSTGSPRAVVRSRESWAGSFAHLNALTGIGPDDSVLVPGPLNSSLYGFAAVHALAIGATAIVPGRWSLKDIGEASVVHTVPHLLPGVIGSGVRTVVVGGAALDPGVRARAEAAGVRVVSYYGATELSFVAVDADGSGLRPFPRVEIEVRQGVVWVRSPWVADGYLAGAAGPLRRDDDGWLSVGDLAEPYEPGGVLRLRGRGGGAIQTGGATVVPEDVEAVLRKVPGVRDVVVVGTPHPHLGAVVTAIVEGGVSRAALEALARTDLDPAQRPRRWHAAPSLPRTPTGKPVRDLVADDFERLT